MKNHELEQIVKHLLPPNLVDFSTFLQSNALEMPPCPDFINCVAIFLKASAIAKARYG